MAPRQDPDSGDARGAHEEAARAAGDPDLFPSGRRQLHHGGSGCRRFAGTVAHLADGDLAAGRAGRASPALPDAAAGRQARQRGSRSGIVVLRDWFSSPMLAVPRHPTPRPQDTTLFPGRARRT
jgi:hypothetical protein